jgi:hypothetical protein
MLRASSRRLSPASFPLTVQWYDRNIKVTPPLVRRSITVKMARFRWPAAL